MRRSTIFAAVLGVLLIAVACATASPRRAAALKLVAVANGLRCAGLRDGAAGDEGVLYVVEQGGLIRVVKGGKVQAQPFLDLRSKVLAGGEQGLLGMAFAPDYATSRQFVVDYTDRNGDTRVVRYRSDGTKALPASARQLLFVDQPYSNHNGGMVAYGERRASSTSGWATAAREATRRTGPRTRPRCSARSSGSIPARPGAKAAIVALGVRNPWRFSFDRANGDLWIGDVGQDSIEEVDHVAWPLRGLLNFGWDVYEGRASFESKPLGPGRSIAPVAQYTHARGCSITGGYVYRGAAVPAAAGRYFYGDYCSGTVWSLKLVGRGRPADPAGALQRRAAHVVRRGRRRRALRRLRQRHHLPARRLPSAAQALAPRDPQRDRSRR